MEKRIARLKRMEKICLAFGDLSNVIHIRDLIEELENDAMANCLTK